MIKIKKFCINGLRGVKSELSLDLNGNSILLYGDNGTGKSSISDVLEWFYYDKIEHLSTEEIGRSGLEALRNTFLPDKEKGIVSFEFTESNLDAEKTIYLKSGKLVCECSNNSNDFDDFIKNSQNENLILRYKDLMNFVLDTKTGKLKSLSDIIGFSEVTNTRDTFKQIVNELKRELRSRNFDNQINIQQAHIIEQFGHNITSDEQFFDSINKLIKPLNIDRKITNFDEIENILELIKKPEDTKIIELQSFYNNIGDFASNFPSKLDEVEMSYAEYYAQFEKIRKDIEKINKIILENLLSEGVNVLKSKTVSEDRCPLCLQPKDKEELLKELEVRIKDLAKYKNEKSKLITTRESSQKVIGECVKPIDGFLSSELFQSVDKEVKVNIEKLQNRFECYSTELAIELVHAKKPKSDRDLIIDREILNQIINLCKRKNEQLKESKKSDLKFDVHSKIKFSQTAYSDIKKLKKEKKAMERQLVSLELIFSEFVKKQKEGLETFLSYISEDVNDIYQFMHPDEKVDNIKLSLLEKDDELIGITIRYKFFGNEVAPPHKYLSESHLNCLGIALFLTSVKAFNENNKFFILDDVISSLDTGHRIRFANLLIEKFPEYQIILLTHEKNWFDYLFTKVKGKNWGVKAIKWSEEKGAYIDVPPEKLKERIEKKIRENDEGGLGNDIRKYLEGILKYIAFNIEVKVNFLFNETNENRMAYELITELKSKIKSHKCTELTDSPIIERVLSSIFIGNKDSHASSFIPNMSDFKAFWGDVKEFEALFYCPSCHKCISLKKYYDPVEKKIRCGCGSKIYDWKK